MKPDVSLVGRRCCAAHNLSFPATVPSVERGSTTFVMGFVERRPNPVVPEGLPGHSPAFQRRVACTGGTSPAGTAEIYPPQYPVHHLLWSKFPRFFAV